MNVDLIVRGGTVVTTDGVLEADIAVEGGVVVGLEAGSETAREEIDARGMHVFPGLIDAHVHFNEPGRAIWEGVRTGSAALAAGGGTLFVDMPLNSDPPLLSAQDFLAKKRAAEAHAVTDFAFWGGLTPDSVAHLPALAELGVVGFKAFMSDSGVPEFGRADDATLYKGMETAAALGVPVAVHAENDALTAAFAAEARTRGATSPAAYLASRPVIAELEAISRALLFAQETGCDLHVVHVSSARGVDLISEARAKGVRATAETCPHYLHFTGEDMERLGARLKCAPPLRSEEERRALWRRVADGDLALIASDHSPAPPELKEREDFFEVWGGIAGVQSSLQTLLTHREAHGVPLARLAALTARGPAERFGLARKGRLEPGYDADMCLVDLNKEVTLKSETLLTKHKLSPYVGQTLRGEVKQTLLRGRTIFKNGEVRPGEGHFVRPVREASA